MRDDSNHISLITKIRAMEGKLLSDVDYNNMHNMNSILEIYAYLHDKQDYREIFDKQDDIAELHRNQLEHLLIHSLYANIIKIYKFAIGDEREFMDIIVSRFEIDILKKCIANIDVEKKDRRVVTYANFFKKHSDINFSEIYKANSIQEFSMYLKNTKYYKYFKELMSKEYKKLSDYETALDIYYFENIWKTKKKFNSDIEEIVTHVIGTEIDLYNIKNIFRCKKFYHMNPEQIKKYVVPIGYKIKKQELENLIQSNDISQFMKEFNKTFYKKTQLSFKTKNIDASFERVINEMHLRFIKKNPNSLARVYTYFDKKSYEIHFITRIIENIRYKERNILI